MMAVKESYKALRMFNAEERLTAARSLSEMDTSVDLHLWNPELTLRAGRFQPAMRKSLLLTTGTHDLPSSLCQAPGVQACCSCKRLSLRY